MHPAAATNDLAAILPDELASDAIRVRARWDQLWPVVGLLLVLSLTAIARWCFLGTALERDEGEFAYGAQRILAGDVPYVSFHAMKLPGIYFAYAGIMTLFGESAWGIHLGLLWINLASTALMFGLGAVLFDRIAGFMAAMAFAVLSLSPAVHGTQAQAEHFVLLPALAGAILLLTARSRMSVLLVSGMCFGLALLAKQHGAMFGIGAILYCCVMRQWRGALVLLCGYLLPLGVVTLWMLWLGGIGPFVFWTWTYPREYVSRLSVAEGLSNLQQELRGQFRWTGPIWFAAAAGAAILFCTRKCMADRRLFVVFWTAASFVAISPGFCFRDHYFVLLLPVVALLSALALTFLVRWRPGRAWHAAGIGFALFVLGWPTVVVARFMAPLSPDDLIRKTYSGFFPESPAIADYLVEHTSEPLAILGSEPQILFYAKRKSVTPHIYMFPLMEPQPYANEMQLEVIHDIEAAKPEYLVYVEHETSWCTANNSERRIFWWLSTYLQQNYYEVGRIEQAPAGPAVQAWGEAIHKPSTSPLQLHVYRRQAGR